MYQEKSGNPAQNHGQTLHLDIILFILFPFQPSRSMDLTLQGRPPRLTTIRNMADFNDNF
jgi:hypothetical protein